MDNLIGRELGPYRILEQIGAGGMATVYRAYHAAMDRYVAVKVLPKQIGLDSKLRQRFQQEVSVIVKLEHAHILPVYDHGQVDERLYMVMRYIEAGTLKDQIAQGPMSLAEVNRVLRQVGGALAYAHRLGVVHRDVKPGNVLVDAQGDCYLTDFGLARILEASPRITATGLGVGTPAYMSPEQGQGGKVGARSDIYSLGVMLYEMVIGQVPYQAETPMAVMLQHVSASLPLPSEAKPDIPKEVERVILKAMAKDPDDRFQTVQEMTAALDAAVRLAEALPGAVASEVPAAQTGAPPSERRLAQLAARARGMAQSGWGRVALCAGTSIIVLLAFLLVLSYVPLRVQIRGGQFEVVVVTAMPGAVVPGETPATAIQLPTVTPSPTPTHTPAPDLPPVTLDSMDSLSGWDTYLDSQKAALTITGTAGITGNAVQISFELQEWGWLGISKEIDPAVLRGTSGLRFHYKGSGAPNTIELKVLYKPNNQGQSAIFSVLWPSVTATEDWEVLEIPVSELSCWTDTPCLDDRQLDLEKVWKIDFAISNKMNLGDTPGTGVLIIDEVQGLR